MKGKGKSPAFSVLSGSGSSYWATLISAVIEDANPDKVVLTFPTANNTLIASDFTIAGKTVSDATWVGAVCTLTVANFPFINKGVYTVSLKGLPVKAITNNITHTPYPAVGDIIEISHGVTFADGQFNVPSGVSAFFFYDNGVPMTASYSGAWRYFYVNYGKLYNWYAIDPSRTGSNSFTSLDTWSVPTSANYDTLLAYLLATYGIGNTNDAVGVGNHLKLRRQQTSALGAPWATTTNPYWGASATHVCLDTYRFCCAPGGQRSGSTGAFGNRTSRVDLRTVTEVAGAGTIKYTLSTDGRLRSYDGTKSNGASVKLVRTATVAEQLQADGAVVDVYYQNDGYPLKCVKIGMQVWTSEVFETKWRDGSNISFAGANGINFSNAEWAALITPGVCDYDNSALNSFVTTYSPLFDKYASNPILTKGEAGSWESTGVRDPMLLVDSEGNMVQEDGKYIMYYNGRDPGIGAGARTKIGRATSVDKINWTKEATNPVFADGNYAAGASVIKRGAGDYILYYGYDAGTKFNYATSEDGINWVANAVGVPILEIGDIAGGISMGLPNVVQIGNTQYMVFEVSSPDFAIYMAKSTDWITWELVGNIYAGADGYFDLRNKANPSLYKADDDYYIIIYNGNAGADAWDLGIIHSNNIETGWKKLQDVPVLSRGIDGTWDDTRIEGGRIYHDRINQVGMKLFYFGLPTNNSFNDGAIGIAEVKPGVQFEYVAV